MAVPQWATSFYDQFVGPVGYSLSLAGSASILSDASGYLSSNAIRIPYGGSLTAVMPAIHVISIRPAFRMRGELDTSCTIEFFMGGASVGGPTTWSAATGVVPLSWGPSINNASPYNIIFDTIVITNNGTPGYMDFDYFYPVPFLTNEAEVLISATPGAFGTSMGTINEPTPLLVLQTRPYNVPHDAYPGVYGIAKNLPVLWTIYDYADWVGAGVGLGTISSTTDHREVFGDDEHYTFTTLGEHVLKLDTYWDADVPDSQTIIPVYIFPPAPTFTVSSSGGNFPYCQPGDVLTITDTTNHAGMTVQGSLFGIYTSGAGPAFLFGSDSYVWTVPDQPGLAHMYLDYTYAVYSSFRATTMYVVFSSINLGFYIGVPNFSWTQPSIYSSNRMYVAGLPHEELLMGSVAHAAGAIYPSGASTPYSSIPVTLMDLFTFNGYTMDRNTIYKTYVPYITGDTVRVAGSFFPGAIGPVMKIYVNNVLMFQNENTTTAPHVTNGMIDLNTGGVVGHGRFNISFKPATYGASWTIGNAGVIEIAFDTTPPS